MLRRHGLNRNKDLTQGRGLTPWDILQFRMGFWSEAASGRPVATGQNEIREQVTSLGLRDAAPPAPPSNAVQESIKPTAVLKSRFSSSAKTSIYFNPA